TRRLTSACSPYTTLFRCYTIWVHPARRGEGFGGQLVRAVAAHYDLPLSKLCFRLPLSKQAVRMVQPLAPLASKAATESIVSTKRSEEHTSELQSRGHLVC